MGIQGFFNYIKNESGRGSRIFNNSHNRYIVNQLPDGLIYDFIFFDFQSGIYGIKNELKEYDYLVRLVYYIKFKLTKGENILYSAAGVETQLRKTMAIILRRFRTFIGISPFFLSGIKRESTSAELITKFDELIAFFVAKTRDNFLRFYVEKTFDNTIDIIRSHGLNNNQAYIFFDGVPSVAKLKEQLLRRIEPTITSNIKRKLNEGLVPVAGAGATFNTLEFENYLSDSQTFSIPIGVGTEILDLLREKFRTTTPDIFINDINKYGEAEHQIMRFIINNGYDAGDNKFLGRRILLSSPDADLILLGFIINTKGYNLDLYRYEFISDDNYQFSMNYTDVSPYIKKVDYILLGRLINTLFPLDAKDVLVGDTLTTLDYQKKKIMDFSFILLILGDDFLPTIPNISSKNIDDIYNVYIKYFKEVDATGNRINKNIIYYNAAKNKYLINYKGFCYFLYRISEIKDAKFGKSLDHNKFDNLKYISGENINRAGENYANIERYYFINDTSDGIKNIFKKIHYYKKGVILHEDDGGGGGGGAGAVKIIPRNLIIANKAEFSSVATPDMLKKYCEGCSFILDLYYNNDIKNYYWVYPFEKSPRANEISDFIRTNIITDSNRESNNKYFSIFNYYDPPYPGEHSLINPDAHEFKYFSRDQYVLYSDSLKLRILTSIKDRINKKRRESGKAEYATNEDAFIYENIEIIYSCVNKNYFNKCIDYHIDLTDAKSKPNTVLLKDNFKGGYYEKYMKYKQKYLQLKAGNIFV